jgi:hypothetical protein
VQVFAQEWFACLPKLITAIASKKLDQILLVADIGSGAAAKASICALIELVSNKPLIYYR